MPWDREVDVLVIGAGGSGMMAASRAAHYGSSVLLVEKSESFGGTTALSGGCMWVPANHLQPPQFNDSPELGLTYLKNLVGKTVKHSMLSTYVDKSREMMQFLDKESPLTLATCDKYCDYYPEVDGGLTGSRTVEPEGIDGESLGRDRKRLRDPQKLTLMFGQISLTAREAHTFITAGRKGSWMAIRKIVGYFLSILFRKRHGRDRRLQRSPRAPRRYPS